MAEFDNVENTHIGNALAQHCALLGVAMKDLIKVAGADSGVELSWVLGAHDLSVERLRRFHYLELEAYQRSEHPAKVTGAIREQWFTTRNDASLYRQVLAKGRRSAWWWGAARTERGTGAYCYLCEQVIHTYDLTRGITHPGRVAVMAHRGRHLKQLLGLAQSAAAGGKP